MGDTASNVTRVNEYLAIWAVIGPVLTAVATTWWNRKNEIENRNFAKNREDEIQQRQDKIQNNRNEIEFRKNQLQNIKTGVINFISCVIECNNSLIATRHKQVSTLTEIPAILEIHCRIAQKLNDSFSELFLLSPPPELLKSVQNLLKFVTNTRFEEYQAGKQPQISDSIQTLKTEVLKEAQKYVKEEQDSISQLSKIE